MVVKAGSTGEATVEGAGGNGGPEGIIVKFKIFEEPPPGAGLNTIIKEDPSTVRAEAGTVTLSWPELINWGVRVVPLKLTEDVATKLVPVRVTTVSGLPAMTELGVKEVKDGTGLLTVNIMPLVMPPPGDGLVTEMAYNPAEVIKDAGI